MAVPHNGSRTAILIGNGDGTFRAPLVLTDPGLNIPQQQAVADYNGDGFQDLALSLGDGNYGSDADPERQRRRHLPGSGAVPRAAADVERRRDLHRRRPTSTATPSPTSPWTSAAPSPASPSCSTRPGLAPPPTPSAPTLLSPAQDATPAQPVAFDWTDVNAATSYRIQIDDSSNFSAPLVVDRVVTRVAVHRFDAQRWAAALVARAGHQLGRHRGCLVVGAALHSAGPSPRRLRSPGSRSTRRASSAATPRREPRP